jgi:hypothetical protein
LGGVLCIHCLIIAQRNEKSPEQVGAKGDCLLFLMQKTAILILAILIEKATKSKINDETMPFMSD